MTPTTPTLDPTTTIAPTGADAVGARTDRSADGAPVDALLDAPVDATTVDAVVAGADLVVLDAHGVVFDRSFPAFVRSRAVARGEDPDIVWTRWRAELRVRFWAGRCTPAEMWEALFPGDHPGWLTAELERCARPGPLFRFAATTPRRLWLLSNHRSGWLLPRLDRFGLTDRFERVLVSDRLGALKPDPTVFGPVREVARNARAHLLDDVPANVAAARAAGIEAHLVRSPPSPRGRDRKRSSRGAARPASSGPRTRRTT